MILRHRQRQRLDVTTRPKHNAWLLAETRWSWGQSDGKEIVKWVRAAQQYERCMKPAARRWCVRANEGAGCCEVNTAANMDGSK